MIGRFVPRGLLSTHSSLRAAHGVHGHSWRAAGYEGAWLIESVAYEGWLCTCGHWEESYLHCSVCHREPPWGCDCGFCNERADLERAEEVAEDWGWQGDYYEDMRTPADDEEVTGA